MARSGPVTTDTTAVTLGLAQIRIGDSATNIASPAAVLTSTSSIGALANTRFVGNTDWYNLESGYPLVQDAVFPIREAAQLECAFKEVTPANMLLAYGLDPNAATYTAFTAHSGEVPLGDRVAPAFVRMEARYTYPSGTDYMDIIAPRAQVSSGVEMELAAEDAAAVPVVIEFKNADANVSGGNAVWNEKPLGSIQWTSD